MTKVSSAAQELNDMLKVYKSSTICKAVHCITERTKHIKEYWNTHAKSINKEYDKRLNDIDYVHANEVVETVPCEKFKNTAYVLCMYDRMREVMKKNHKPADGAADNHDWEPVGDKESITQWEILISELSGYHNQSVFFVVHILTIPIGFMSAYKQTTRPYYHPTIPGSQLAKPSFRRSNFVYIKYVYAATKKFKGVGRFLQKALDHNVAIDVETYDFMFLHFPLLQLATLKDYYTKWGFTLVDKNSEDYKADLMDVCFADEDPDKTDTGINHLIECADTVILGYAEKYLSDLTEMKKDAVMIKRINHDSVDTKRKSRRLCVNCGLHVY